MAYVSWCWVSRVLRRKTHAEVRGLGAALDDDDVLTLFGVKGQQLGGQGFALGVVPIEIDALFAPGVAAGMSSTATRTNAQRLLRRDFL